MAAAAPTRVVAFIDGFNLYHAIKALGGGHLRWVNLWSLCADFAPAPVNQLVGVHYFSAYATHRKGSYARHQEYIAALKVVGVRPMLGRFKKKDRRCFGCHNTWKDHEEKETDVNIALRLFEDALDDVFDTALLLSGDSDLVPAVHLIRRRFPTKAVRILTPPGRLPSSELMRAAGGIGHGTIQPLHVERNLLPAVVVDPNGRPVATRPTQYNPPSGWKFKPVP